MTATPGLTFAVALAAGMLTHVVARKLQVPELVLLLAVGVLLGPEILGVIRPESLGTALDYVVGMSVAVILFEGGLNLNLGRLRGEQVIVRRLVTLGALVTAMGGTLAARYLMGWDLRISLLFGSLVVVTGPTVITPLVRRISLRSNLRTILEAEGVLIDPIGAIGAVVVLEFVMTSVEPGVEPGMTQLLGLPTRLLLGAGIGAAGGIAMGLLLRDEEFLPPGLENVTTLALVLALFEVSESIQPESGIMAAAVAGIVVGNMETHVEEELKHFKEQLTVMLLGLLFVLLAGTVELEAIARLGWRGAAVVAVLMLVVRPVSVWLCSLGTGLELRERLFLGWISPRGIVAAAVASLFARTLPETTADGAAFQALVFCVIAVTVAVQGGTARWLMERWGLGEKEGGGGKD